VFCLGRVDHEYDFWLARIDSNMSVK
jgi:hypothetical protein